MQPGTISGSQCISCLACALQVGNLSQSTPAPGFFPPPPPPPPEMVFGGYGVKELFKDLSRDPPPPPLLPSHVCSNRRLRRLLLTKYVSGETFFVCLYVCMHAVQTYRPVVEEKSASLSPWVTSLLPALLRRRRTFLGSAVNSFTLPPSLSFLGLLLPVAARPG